MYKYRLVCLEQHVFGKSLPLTLTGSVINKSLLPSVSYPTLSSGHLLQLQLSVSLWTVFTWGLFEVVNHCYSCAFRKIPSLIYKYPPVPAHWQHWKVHLWLTPWLSSCTHSSPLFPAFLSAPTVCKRRGFSLKVHVECTLFLPPSLWYNACLCRNVSLLKLCSISIIDMEWCCGYFFTVWSQLDNSFNGCVPRTKAPQFKLKLKKCLVWTGFPHLVLLTTEDCFHDIFGRYIVFCWCICICRLLC